MDRASQPKTFVGYHFQSTDLDEFCEVISQRIRPCRLLARSRSAAALRQHRAGSLGFSVIHMTPTFDVAVEPVEDSYLFQTALAGAFRARCEGPERTYAEGDVHVVNPSAPIRVFPHPGCAFLVIRAAKSTLDQHMRVLAGVDGGCRLPEILPGTGNGAAASLWRYLEFLHVESMIPESALQEGDASRSAEQMLASLMLAVAERDGARARLARDVVDHVRRAEEFIDAHLDDDIGLADIVGTAGADARAIDAGFRSRRGAGPLAWRDRRRKERAAHEIGPAHRGDDRPALTPRELEIARLVAAGFNNLEIAKGLSISRNTVKEALKRIFRKVDVDSRAELVLRLSEAGLL